MPIKYNSEQAKVMERIGYPDFDFETAVGEEYDKAYDALSDALTYYGVVHDEINDFGLACESILYMIADT
jgi:hypothetical protein